MLVDEPAGSPTSQDASDEDSNVSTSNEDSVAAGDSDDDASASKSPDTSFASACSDSNESNTSASSDAGSAASESSQDLITQLKEKLKLLREEAANANAEDEAFIQEKIAEMEAFITQSEIDLGHAATALDANVKDASKNSGWKRSDPEKKKDEDSEDEEDLKQPSKKLKENVLGF